MKNRIAESILALFDAQANKTSFKRVIYFFMGVLIFGILSNSIYDLLKLAMCKLFTPYPQEIFVFGIGLLFFIVILFFLRRDHKKAKQAASKNLTPPEPHQVLVWMMSTPNDHNWKLLKDNQSLTPQNVMDTVQKASLEDIKTQTNWGVYLKALSHHEPKLKQVWLLYTNQGIDFLPAFTALTTRVLPRVAIELFLIDAYNPQKNVDIMRSAYQTSKKQGVQIKNIITDITGGTSAMTAALVLATSEYNRKLEYFEQNNLKDPNQKPILLYTDQEMANTPSDISLE